MHDAVSRRHAWWHQPTLLMTLRQALLFLVAYVALVAAAIWFDLAILCRGNAKFDGGCGGFAFYIPLWEIFLAPLPIAVLILEAWRKSTPPTIARLAGYLAAILVVTEVGFLLIEKFPVLLATEATAIAIFAILRWKVVHGSALAASKSASP